VEIYLFKRSSKMKLRDENGKFMTDNWVNRFKAASRNEKIRVGIIVVIVMLALYEMT